MNPEPTTPDDLRAAWIASEQAKTDALIRAEQLQRACNRHVQALEFYARAENWTEGSGVGPARAPACIADGGRIARQALDPSGMNPGSIR